MIKNIKAFPDTGRFYRGNLHCHTTKSDGVASPEERIIDYRHAGYDFIAVTDHDYYSCYDEYNDDNFLVIPGVELGCSPNTDEALGYHTIGIALPGKNTIPAGKISFAPDAKVAEQIEFLTSHGNIAITAHPYWLQMRMEAFAALKDTIGFEIYNTMCDNYHGTGLSESYYDYAIANGQFPFVFASDDYHDKAGRNVPDHFSGYIMVKADSLTHETIMESILSGNFYASHDGPQIFNFEIKDDYAIIETSACRQICLRSTHIVGFSSVSYKNDLTHAEFKLWGGEEHIRAVAIDATGHASWTQVIPVENIK